MYMVLFYVLPILIIVSYILFLFSAAEKVKSFFRKKWWILPIILVVAQSILISCAVSTSIYTKNQIIERIKELTLTQTEVVDRKLGYHGTAYQVNVEKWQIEVEQPEFSIDVYDLFYDGYVSGVVNVDADIPELYPLLEKEDFELSEVKDILDINNEIHGILQEWNKNERCIGKKYLFQRGGIGFIYFLDSKGNKYSVSSTNMGIDLKKNDDVIFEYEKITTSSVSGSGCYWCNGTGKVRYNYGSSDIEAVLSGHDAYTYGICGSCGGTGEEK